MRVVLRLEPDHKKIWYDYTRLKYSEFSVMKDDRKIKQILVEGKEELEWLISVLNRKDVIMNKSLIQ